MDSAGGARGIGLALARGAAELGSDVAVLDVLEKPSDAFFEFETDLRVRAGYYRFTASSPISKLNRSFIDSCGF